MQPFANPARLKFSKSLEVYPYYAGFSEVFVAEAIDWVKNHQSGVILDPWNGAGTTTRVAESLSINSLGVDLNPAMVLVAKARLLDAAESSVLLPLAQRIVGYVESIDPPQGSEVLGVFFKKTAAETISSIAMSIWIHLVNRSPPQPNQTSLSDISPLPAMLFVGLFNITRELLNAQLTSNPTWIKMPKNLIDRTSCAKERIYKAFLIEVQRLSRLMPANTGTVKNSSRVKSKIILGDSRNLRLKDSSISGVVTSPPYCTRLDYGRSTMPELLVLEAIGLASYEDSRKKLTGSTITKHVDYIKTEKSWGKTCADLLGDIYRHPSKGSTGYYYSSHHKYFEDMAISISEISRVIRPGGRMCAVVQDSFYKEIHNDLPKIFSEMAGNVGLKKIHQFSYPKKSSLAGINPHTAAYREQSLPTEAALLFQKV